MDNTTLEQVEKEEKRRYKKETYQAIFYIAVGAATFWGIIEGIEYLQMKTFATADSFITTQIPGFLFKVALAVLCLLIIPYIFEYIFYRRLMLKKGRFSKKILLLILGSIPILYLSFFNYLDVGKDSITYDPFWPGDKKVYDWEEIDAVVIDRLNGSARANRRNKRFDYFVYFKDGTQLDIWGDSGMNLKELKLVDDQIRAKGIPKFIEELPDINKLKEVHGDHPETDKMIDQIFSE